MTLDFFRQFHEIVARRPDRIALQLITESGRESFCYRRVAEETAKLSVFLQTAGIRPGDAVGILMENHPRWGIAFLAAQSAGAVVVPLDILHDPATLARLIGHAGCKLVVLSGRLLPVWSEIRAELSAAPAALVTGGGAEGLPHWDDILALTGSCPALPLVPRSLDDELVILYTSGTTGTPKGVVLTQRNVYRNVVEILRVIHADEDDHMLSVLPLYHVLALMTNFIIPLYVGGRVTYLQSLDAQRILRTFREEGITIFVCVPQFYYLMQRRILEEVARQGLLKRVLFRRLLALSRFGAERLGVHLGRWFFRPVHERFGPRFRLMCVGGARFDPAVARWFRDLGFRLVQGYGLTETAALVTAATPEPHMVGSVGRPLAHTEVRIDSPGEDGIGEVLIRGENVMKGYLDNPEATRAAIRDGWLHSGDLGYLDRHGCLHITGRKKEVVVLSSGKNIYPEEVEQFYLSHCPQIKELAVIGIPGDSGTGERLHAVIVPDFDHLKAHQIVNAYDAIRWQIETVSQRLPSYKRVSSFEIRTEPLPRTTTRKLKRFEIEREVRERRPARTQRAPAAKGEPETPTEATLFQLIRGLKGSTAIDRSMNLELDLGFTSLERVELVSSIQEAFGVCFTEAELGEIFTVGDLVVAIERRQAGPGPVETRVTWREILASPLSADDARQLQAVLKRRRWFEPVYQCLAWSGRILAWVLLRARYRGLEHLPRQYPFLLCPNHLSFVDPFLLACGLPPRLLRRLFFLAASEFFTSAVVAWLGRLAKIIPVSPDRELRRSLRLAAEGLRQGLVLCVFPEGERSIDGTLKPFRKGPAILAVELGVPAVPVAIRGTYEVWRRGSNRIRLHPVSVTFGPSLTPAAGETYEAFNARLSQAVASLL
jgi:long-chain acyl-CoA synthetase